MGLDAWGRGGQTQVGYFYHTVDVKKNVLTFFIHGTYLRCYGRPA